jgi:hypothetical protein
MPSFPGYWKLTSRIPSSAAKMDGQARWRVGVSVAEAAVPSTRMSVLPLTDNASTGKFSTAATTDGSLTTEGANGPGVPLVAADDAFDADGLPADPAVPAPAPQPTTHAAASTPTASTAPRRAAPQSLALMPSIPFVCGMQR